MPAPISGESPLNRLQRREKYPLLYGTEVLDTNTDMTYKEIRYGLGNISVGDYQPVYNNEVVVDYVTKYIGKDVDYDIVFKS